MAILQLEDGRTYTQLEDISRKLEPLNVRLNYWPVRQHQEFQALLNKPALDDAEKKQVLQEFLQLRARRKAVQTYRKAARFPKFERGEEARGSNLRVAGKLHLP
jgi:1,2-dihydroxy-3-keto-5-methylthiopentene dioxygenase